MKTRINLAIDKDLLSTIKTFAMRNDISLSELVEEYFRLVKLKLKNKAKNDIPGKVEKKKKTPILSNRELREEYYEARAEKYGFKSNPGRKRNT
jgi:hypothetical protein